MRNYLTPENSNAAYRAELAIKAREEEQKKVPDMTNAAFKIRDMLSGEGYVFAASEFLSRWAFYSRRQQDILCEHWGL